LATQLFTLSIDIVPEEGVHQRALCWPLPPLSWKVADWVEMAFTLAGGLFVARVGAGQASARSRVNPLTWLN